MEASKKHLYIIAAVAFVLITAAIYFLFIFHKNPAKPKSEEVATEVKQLSDIELAKRPYVTLTPTTDGAEIIMSVENMSNFDKIEYELTYQADNPQISGEKIERGSTGTDVNTKDPKYKKSILLGTASRGVRSPDRGVADGKLTMHMFKGETEYQAETDWNLIHDGAKATTLTSKDNKFKLKVPGFGKDHWIIVSDTIGFPSSPSFDSKNVQLPVNGIFSVAAELKSKADLSITFDKDLNDPKLFSYSNSDSKWDEINANYDSTAKTLTAPVASFATFVVVSSPK